MPFSKANREQIRCLNAACPSAKDGRPGRVLLESVGGVHFKEQGGDKLAGLFWIFAECGKCGQRRYNPAGVVFDGMGLAVERTMQAVAARIDEGEPTPTTHQPRRHLRGDAA